MQLQGATIWAGWNLQVLHAIGNIKGAFMKPGDFALGSEKSRAAARRLVEQRSSDREHFTLWMNIGHEGPPSCTPWKETANGRLARVCGMPDGMTIEEAERIMAERGPQRQPEFR